MVDHCGGGVLKQRMRVCDIYFTLNWDEQDDEDEDDDDEVEEIA